MAAKLEVLTPLVAEGLAIIARRDAKTAEREAKVAELKVIDDELKKLDEELAVVNEGLIKLGGGRYRDEANHFANVIPGVPPSDSPDTFELPEGSLDIARGHAGEHFRKLFDRKEIFIPRKGFDAIAEILLTPKPARELVALCLVPGKPKGGRSAYVRWK